MGTTQHPAPPSGRSPVEIDPRPPGLVMSIVLGTAVLAVLLWQLVGVADDGQQLQVLDPELHPVWKAVLVATLAGSIACSAVAWARRRWTMPVALVNTAVNAAGAAALIGLAVAGALFAPTPPGRFGASDESLGDLSDLTELFLLLVAVVAIWDSLDGLLRAHRRRSVPTRVHAPTHDDEHRS
ncbi:hypothetical protein [Georgenia sp. Z1491]|uniref:hypothetical protein n=1 Tax=Georgenia sp. Z1491 TaxID=3416707 RepID=UPI003CF97864